RARRHRQCAVRHRCARRHERALTGSRRPTAGRLRGDPADRRHRPGEPARRERLMRLRAPAPGDAEAVAALVIAGHIADVGEAAYSLEDLRDDWAASGFELARDAVVA